MSKEGKPLILNCLLVQSRVITGSFKKKIVLFQFTNLSYFIFLALVTGSVQEVQHDLPPQYSPQVPTGPEQQLQSYPAQTMQPYIQQPPYQQEGQEHVCICICSVSVNV